ncbi:hypothetical protein ACVK00_000809 [Burkholderia sp. PvR073]
MGECARGAGGGASRNVGAQHRRGWMERFARRQPVRMDRACGGDVVLPGVLGDVAARYGDATSDWVALQLEYAK